MRARRGDHAGRRDHERIDLGERCIVWPALFDLSQRSARSFWQAPFDEAVDALVEGRRVLLVTVVKTWGSSPRPEGAIDLPLAKRPGDDVGRYGGG